MNKKILIIIIILLALGAGGYFFTKAQNDNSLQGQNGNTVVQSHRSYEIEVTSDTSNIQPKQKATITYKIKNEKGELVKNFQVAHEKIMHFITVRKDLAYFQHLHPEFNDSTGEFTVDVTFPEDGPYRIFPDFTPGDENPQKLPVTVNHDIDVGNANNYTAQNVVVDSEESKKYGEYTIATTFVPEPKQQQEVIYTLNISKNGKPVTNLEQYLGALGHSVILKEESLDFIHTHALEGNASSEEHGGAHDGSQSTASTGLNVSFASTFPESGVYKIFTQFQHEGEVQIVDYTVNVE